MIDIYLCEDQKEQLNHLKSWLGRYIEESGTKARIVSARTSPAETLEDESRGREGAGNSEALSGYDHENGVGSIRLFFIDIRLSSSGMDGFGLAEKVKRRNADAYIVYLTSKSEWAYRAFEYPFEVLDYIVKDPAEYLSKELSTRMKERLERIFRRISLKEKEKDDCILVESGSRMVRVKRRDIISIEAIKGKHQLEIITENGMITTQMSLKEIEKMLDDRIIYVNKSCIIFKNKIREIDRKNRMAIMTNGKKIEISYRKVKEVCGLL